VASCLRSSEALLQGHPTLHYDLHRCPLPSTLPIPLLLLLLLLLLLTASNNIPKH